MIKKILNNAVAKNAGWIMFGRIAQMLINLIVGILTARYLGPSNYGLINYASAYTAFFMAFCTLGINSILVKELIEHPDEEGEIIGSSLLLRAISSFLSAGIIVCMVGLVDADEPTTITVTILCSLGMVLQMFETFNYWFQSKLRSKITAIISLIAYIITAGYKVVLLALGKSVEWFAFANSLDYMLVGIMLYFAYKNNSGKKLAFSKSVSKRILSKSVYFILPSLMVSIYGYTDKFMLKQMLNEAEVGYYSTAISVCNIWCFVLTAIIDSFYPSIMSAHNVDNKLFEKRNKQLYAIIFYISIFVSICFCVFGGLVIKILFGEEFVPSVPSLKVITWYTTFSYLGVARNAWIVSENKQKYLKYIYVFAAISNIIMNSLFIPIWGTVGAALASLITQILTTMVIPIFIKPLKRNAFLMVEAIMLKQIF